MRSFKETKSDATEEDWKKLLSELADKQTAACNKRFDIKRFAVEMLRKIPEAIRETAAKIHKLAISAIGKLVSTVFNWLDHALHLPHGFYSNILEKIDEFGNKVDEWVSAAFNAVNGAFESALEGFISYGAVDFERMKQVILDGVSSTASLGKV